MLSALSDWVTEVIDALGYVGVALLIALENLFPPIPSEIVLPFAGFVASDRGGFALVGMIIAATIGSLVGAWILYGLSAWIGRERLRRFLLRYGKWLRLTTDGRRPGRGWFDRRAVVAVLVGRCVPLIRSVVSIPAGFRRMPFGIFTLYTLIGSLVWNAVLISIGYVLARQLGGRGARAGLVPVRRAGTDPRRHRVVHLAPPVLGPGPRSELSEPASASRARRCHLRVLALEVVATAIDEVVGDRSTDRRRPLRQLVG